MRLAIALTVLLVTCTLAQGQLFSAGQGNDDVHVNQKLASAWDQLYVTFGKFNKLPMTLSDAVEAGWTLNNTGSSGPDNCNNGHWQGRRYLYQGDISSMLLFDSLGELAGFQLGLTNHPTGSIPPWELVGNTYVFTTYFRDPSTICSGSPSGSGNPVGDRLWLKMSDNNYMAIPLVENQVTNGTKWVQGKCFWTMGNHYWYNIYSNMNCPNFFPIFLLYNGGLLNGYGFATMLSEPSSRYEHPGGSVLKAFFQPDTLPQCILTVPKISTLHVYFTNPLVDFC